MKFAKELDENAIPEWKDKYFDYRGAKKKLKAVARAARNIDRSSPLARRSPFGNSSSVRDAPVLSFLTREEGERNDADGQDDNRQHPLRSDSNPQGQEDDERETTPRAHPMPVANERSPLRTEERRDGAPRFARYGSIIGSPPSGSSPMPELTPQQTQASLLELPDPALDPTLSEADSNGTEGRTDDRGRALNSNSPEMVQRELLHPDATLRQFAHTGNAYEVRQPTDEPPAKPKRHASFFLPKRASSVPQNNGRPAFVRRMFSAAHTAAPSPARRTQQNDVALESYREVDFRQAEFFLFLDKQLDKIEDFYKTKENEATERLKVLREQLHVLRNRRLEDIAVSEQKRHSGRQLIGNGALSDTQGDVQLHGQSSEDTMLNGNDVTRPVVLENGNLSPEIQNSHAHRWASVTSQVANTIDKINTGHVGKTSKAMEELGTPSNYRLNPDNRDYTRRKVKENVPAYRAAKRKLKTALQEYYRGLELLKSYALLNRTAFRKINKKFDKTVDVPIGATMRYMSEKVNKAYFVNSDVTDGHLQAVEDLYARYFERGNKKVAIGKLRGKLAKLGDYTGSLWRTGLFLGFGAALAVQGLVSAVMDLYDRNPTIQVFASYLLQIYGGYFLLLLLVGLFCIDARIFSRGKVNYQFVFEFDTRHTLDWRQLSEIPSVFFSLLGLAMYLNFTIRVGGDEMYIYWPVVLVGVSVVLMCLPPRLFYWNARIWFLYSMWRLIWAGLYPVEFRDFFLGDMFCSQTYALGNIELFFCLYAKQWHPLHLSTCSSSNSRLLGFLSTLPGIWRALQCIRRYYDTRNFFPHLVNCGKYTFTILQYLTLSLFRINKTHELKALFIACATINAIYCSIWDVKMDWSLWDLDWKAKHPLLRDTLALKRNLWFYYFAMVIDPILRFNWIFYAIFADDVQHSSVISFSVALSEVIRRGIWTVLRVENEHCTNVSKNRAARDVELPYQRTTQEPMVAEYDGTGAAEDAPTNIATADEESGPHVTHGTAHTTATEGRTQATTPSSSSVLRQRRIQAAESPVAMALRRVGSAMATAHSQDYERKRRPVQSIQQEEQESDEEEDEEETAEAEELREHGSMRSQEGSQLVLFTT